MNDWSFGIVYGSSTIYLQEVIQSIREQGIPDYEIILVGNSSLIPEIEGDDILKINFDETIRSGWITKKKNIVCQFSKKTNISLHHDYVKLNPNWFSGFESFGYDWDVCMTPIRDINGLRFRDWVKWPPEFVDYYSNPDTSEMYVSGSYYCVKKNYSLINPLDERLSWAQGEDVEWSKRLRKTWNYKCNPKSSVKLCKIKDHHPQPETDPNKEFIK